MEISTSKKIILFIIFVIVLVGIYFFLSYYMSADVYRAHEGVIVKDNQIVEEEVLIIIAGERKTKLFEKKMIYGTVTIVDGAKYNIMLTDDGDVYRGEIYEGFGASNLVEVGKINATSGLKEINISLDNIDEKYGSGSILYGPASNLEEVQAIHNMLNDK